MKNVALAVASAFAIAPAFAQWDGPYHAAQPRPDERDYARVIESTPVYTAAREECWNPRIQDFEEMRGRNNGLDTSYCRKTSGEATLEGYDVRYRIAGREYVARMTYDPRRTLRLGTDVNSDGTPIG